MLEYCAPLTTALICQFITIFCSLIKSCTLGSVSVDLLLVLVLTGGHSVRSRGQRVGGELDKLQLQ